MPIEEVSLDYIANCIRRAGFNPAEQLQGYLETGDERYITRKGNARELISDFSKAQIKNFLKRVQC